ncbi:MAG: pilin [Candidatus Paceibacteria bacterium]
MKKTSYLSLVGIPLITFMCLIGATTVVHAQTGVENGSSCDLVSGSGKADGIIQNGACVAASAYTTQSGSASGSGFTALAPIPGLTDQSATSVINSSSLASFFNNLYKYLIGLAATLAVIEIIWGGLQYATTESVGNKEEGKNRIQQAIFGLVLVLSPVLVFSIINPSILNLSLNLPSLNLNTPVVTTGGAGTGNTTAANASGCVSSLNQGVVNCDTQNAANAFAASCSNNSGQVYNSNDTTHPYAASCNVLQPFQGNRNYTDVTQIPAGYFCYKVQVFNADKTTNITYVCGSSKASCDDLSINKKPVSGTILSDCAKY